MLPATAELEEISGLELKPKEKVGEK